MNIWAQEECKWEVEKAQTMRNLYCSPKINEGD